MASIFDVEAARAQFPALQQEQIFMDNAGMLRSMELRLPGLVGYVTDDIQGEVRYSEPLRTRVSLVLNEKRTIRLISS